MGIDLGVISCNTVQSYVHLCEIVEKIPFADLMPKIYLVINKFVVKIGAIC